MIPFALGTQTLGSVLRPASYCGICGFKPTFGLIPIDGALPFAPSLDTVGLFTETAADMACVWARSFGEASTATPGRAAHFRVDCEEPMRRAVDDAAGRLRASGVGVDSIDPPEGWQGLNTAARVINDYEGARTHAERYRQFGDRMGARLAELVRRGLGISGQQYVDACEHVGKMQFAIDRIFLEYPAILSPAATGPAPAGYDSTGDPANNAPWTALGVPAISVPLPVGDAPLGLQITAPRGQDDALVSIAEYVEQFLK
jgi:Asp-tRNA(Asn)/Glu-tRNA(Gln) amidotransferase A subunit family amidase